jgi:hypothetical protein
MKVSPIDTFNFLSTNLVMLLYFFYAHPLNQASLYLKGIVGFVALRRLPTALS